MNLRELVNKIDLYNLMIFNLFVFYFIGLFLFDWVDTLQVPIAVLTAVLLDTIIYYYKTKLFEVSKSGIITGFFIGLVLANSQQAYVPVIAAAIAIIGKHIGDYFMGLIKQRGHIFNPAMVGILLSILIFKTSDGWGGASSLIAVALLGLLLMYKFRRFDLFVSFIVTYFIVLFLLNFGYGDINNFQNRFLDSTLYFFAFFMLVEPRTSPTNSKGRIIYGAISGVIISLTAIFLPAYTFTAGLLICNLFVPFINYFSLPRAQSMQTKF